MQEGWWRKPQDDRKIKTSVETQQDQSHQRSYREEMRHFPAFQQRWAWYQRQVREELWWAKCWRLLWITISNRNLKLKHPCFEICGAKPRTWLHRVRMISLVREEKLYQEILMQMRKNLCLLTGSKAFIQQKYRLCVRYRGVKSGWKKQIVRKQDCSVLEQQSQCQNKCEELRNSQAQRWVLAWWTKKTIPTPCDVTAR